MMVCTGAAFFVRLRLVHESVSPMMSVFEQLLNPETRSTFLTAGNDEETNFSYDRDLA